MKKTATILLLVFLSCRLFAQHAHFTTSGTIEFEKKVNLYAVLKKEMTSENEAFFKPFYEEFVKENPQFRTHKSVLSFGDNKTLFVPEEEELAKRSWGVGPIDDQNNTIYTDFATKLVTDQKKVFDETFLVKDTARAIKWKITEETRQIAGYTCRRANGIMLDSIYVVAFYTTEIPVSGGPESFNGLPGMILGIALPHDNVTWFATKLTETTVPANTIVPPKKGKPTDNKTLKETLHKATKDWGQWGQRYLLAFQL